MLISSDAQRELMVFIAKRLRPRLKNRTDDWEEDDEDTHLNRESISHAFTCLYKIYIWLGHPPGHMDTGQHWNDNSSVPSAFQRISHTWSPYHTNGSPYPTGTQEISILGFMRYKLEARGSV
jgi:hypothetical protein